MTTTEQPMMPIPEQPTTSVTDQHINPRMTYIANLSTVCSVHLTPEGLSELRRWREKNHTEGDFLPGDRDRLWSFPLWEFMAIFGPELGDLGHCPFVDGEIALSDVPPHSGSMVSLCLPELT